MFLVSSSFRFKPEMPIFLPGSKSKQLIKLVRIKHEMNLRDYYRDRSDSDHQNSEIKKSKFQNEQDRDSNWWKQRNRIRNNEGTLCQGLIQNFFLHMRYWLYHQQYRIAVTIRPAHQLKKPSLRIFFNELYIIYMNITLNEIYIYEYNLYNILNLFIVVNFPLFI